MQIIKKTHQHKLYEKLDTKFLRVLRVKNEENLKNLNDEYYLVDAFVDEFGGAGKRLALEWFKDIDCSKFILAGGLNKDNLKELNHFGFFVNFRKIMSNFNFQNAKI